MKPNNFNPNSAKDLKNFILNAFDGAYNSSDTVSLTDDLVSILNVIRN